jgi:hypothetical protein
LEKNANDIYKISHEVYGLETISKNTVFCEDKLFQDRREDVTAHEWSGGLTTSRTDSNVEKLAEMVRNGHQLTVWKKIQLGCSKILGGKQNNEKRNLF